MCGIAGIAAREEYYDDVLKELIRLLESLEYRGYDSAGIAVYDVDSKKIRVWKKKGKVADLVKLLRSQLGDFKLKASVGIAHTRWATHGEPKDENAHPHIDCEGKVAVVHNGIISNYKELKRELEARGHSFRSETDTEVFAHLFEEELKRKEPFEAFKAAVARLEGYYAIVAITSLEPHKVFFARKESPLVVGRGPKGNYVSSDVVSLVGNCWEVSPLYDDDVGWMNDKEIYVERGGVRRRLSFIKPTWSPVQAQKGSYEYFMLKEIHEQPQVVKETLISIASEWDKVEEVVNLLEGWAVVVAAGTSYHAGLIFSYNVMKETGRYIPVIDASEAPHFSKLLKGTVVAISQSGETYDTLKAVRIAKENGAKVVGVVNVVGSTLDREADVSLYTRAGPEIGVAATKTFLTQLSVLNALVARMVGEGANRVREMANELSKITKESIEVSAGYAKGLADQLYTKRDMYVLGTGISYPVAMEGALKIKEISYVHAEAYPAGEAKHGPIALAEPGFPVLLVWTPEDVEKLEVAEKEFESRGSEVYWVAPRGDVPIPEVDWKYVPFALTPPLQLLSYYMAVKKGLDPDKPRNLAKSVTVH
ncbi:glutamine--fructose-6-phosphate transaminase (isomerizing) [Ignicoccus hospitalis]|uniref:Glutamine--fructose-6-phosphate aminotransferase [isomerizing] n=1 Tax=Ignicoccus hospitalis (strain KIN4/I / DSM 18386 / JCM 14125) TaxID=453591 RepID=A8A8V3_IGNH4|nr:glutamine--fructose-6-phosphate transaminase (isomerizing) [Ignicoccus hospitalis]ABU81355.1 glutamine--fructose-6-phosphate transaminase [Ignicoccus hospitalis KIN4/I]HIH90341.1 glutamine--fructose-6-phosphate transaminase (isomerizing) [Desulfurococcaceae archaeon]